MTFSIDLSFLALSYKWNLTICGILWLASLFLRFIYVTAYISISLPLIIKQYAILFIHTVADWHLGHFQPFGYYSVPMYMHMHVIEYLFLILLGLHLGLELLGHTETLCLLHHFTFSLSMYIFTIDVWKFQFLYILTNTCYCLIKIVFILVDVNRALSSL